MEKVKINNVSGSNVNLNSDLSNVSQIITFRERDKNELLGLIEALYHELKNISESQSNEVEQIYCYIDEIKKQILSDKPTIKWLSIISNNLKSAADFFINTAPAVVAAVDKIRDYIGKLIIN